VTLITPGVGHRGPLHEDRCPAAVVSPKLQRLGLVVFQRKLAGDPIDRLDRRKRLVCR